MTHKKRSRWRLAGQVLTVAFVALVAWLIAGRVKTINWEQVGETLLALDAWTLAGALLLAATSYALYCGFELLGRAYTGHGVPRPRVAAIAFVSYAFNLNLGAWVGGIGFRYRLYSRNGLKPGMIARILGMSLATNWLGYCVLAGAAFLLGFAPVPENWKVGEHGLRLAGLGMIGVALAYFSACAWSRRRTLHFGETHVPLPPLSMAVAQLGLSGMNWTAMALLVFVLLGGVVPLEQVLAVLLLAAIAGVITHIPAGLGVIEAVFLALLGAQVEDGPLLGALVAYRGIYYLLPALIAVGVYLALEGQARRQHAHA